MVEMQSFFALPPKLNNILLFFPAQKAFERVRSFAPDSMFLVSFDISQS